MGHSHPDFLNIKIRISPRTVQHPAMGIELKHWKRVNSDQLCIVRLTVASRKRFDRWHSTCCLNSKVRQPVTLI